MKPRATHAYTLTRAQATGCGQGRGPKAHPPAHILPGCALVSRSASCPSCASRPSSSSRPRRRRGRKAPALLARSRRLCAPCAHYALYTSNDVNAHAVYTHTPCTRTRRLCAPCAHYALYTLCPQHVPPSARGGPVLPPVQPRTPARLCAPAVPHGGRGAARPSPPSMLRSPDAPPAPRPLPIHPHAYTRPRSPAPGSPLARAPASTHTHIHTHTHTPTHALRDWTAGWRRGEVRGT
jgi:hypothetical protein